MKFLISSDWHIKIWSDKETTADNIPLRLHELFSAITQMCEYARANQIDTIIVAGDINDLKSIVHVKAFVMLKQILECYPDIRFIITHGNHDSTARIDDHSAIDLLRNDSHITTVVTESLIVDNIGLVPYSKTQGDDIVELSGNVDILVGHFGVNEAMLSNGHSLKSSITAKDLRAFKLVLLGHYHKPQEFENIYYMGSLVQLRRDEANEVKRFLVVDSETFEVESIPITGYRKYHELTIDDAETADAVMEEAKTLKENGDFVTIRKTILEVVDNPGEFNIIDEYEADYIMRGITTAMKLSEQMKKYAEIEGIPEDEISEYVDVGLEALADLEVKEGVS